MGDCKYASGELVRLCIENKAYTEEGLAVVGTQGILDVSSGIIYSRICMSAFPSCDDFSGASTYVTDGAIATVVSYVGRPMQISSSKNWEKYDIYEILVGGAVRSIFSYNLEVHNNYFKKNASYEHADI
jgi:hypothetical protein